jgi:hypothetical protein
VILLAADGKGIVYTIALHYNIARMKEIRWSLLKDERLKKARGISFEEILGAELIGVKKHLSRENQNIMLFVYKGYIWVVPYVIDGDGVYLKTLFPSRKYTREHMRRIRDEKR